jgi:hypothetical protein
MTTHRIPCSVLAGAAGVSPAEYERAAAPVVTEEMREERLSRLMAVDDSWLVAQWGQGRDGFAVAAVSVHVPWVFRALAM